MQSIQSMTYREIFLFPNNQKKRILSDSILNTIQTTAKKLHIPEAESCLIYTV